MNDARLLEIGTDAVGQRIGIDRRTAHLRCGQMLSCQETNTVLMLGTALVETEVIAVGHIIEIEFSHLGCLICVQRYKFCLIYAKEKGEKMAFCRILTIFVENM
jgi:hypothetical protein